jgi:ParB family chromosome partitioning protein
VLKAGGLSTPPEEGRKIVPLGLLIEDPRNERKVYRNMEGLIATVKAVGIIEPLTVVPHEGGRYMITTGHRRYRAAKAAGLEQVTVIVSDGESETVRRRKSIISNVQREDIGPVELAEGLRTLLDEDEQIKSQRQLANTIGKTETWISGILRILDLPLPLQEKLRKSPKQVPYDAVMNISRLTEVVDQERLIEALLNGATNQEIREEINALKGKAAATTTVKKPKEVFQTTQGATVIVQSLTENLTSSQVTTALAEALKEANHRS